MFERLTNTVLGRYHSHPEAVIITCYFNPMNSPYRKKAFDRFYESIRHLNHRVVECVIGGGRAQLPINENISRVYTDNLLWHKEALLNTVIARLPQQFKYIFWVDADVLFTNKRWLVEGVHKLQSAKIIQPFEYCVHLDKDETKPSFDLNRYRATASFPSVRHAQVWRSFCANFATTTYASNENYDKHGHVGFAWGARREVLEAVPLYDKALIGGADHIIAHAAAGHIPHSCIKKAFADDIDAVTAWSKLFYKEVKGQIDYVYGDLYHIWHGDIDKRQYLKRIQDFTVQTKSITKKDKNGLYVTGQVDSSYIRNYFRSREVTPNLNGDVFMDGFLYPLYFNSLQHHHNGVLVQESTPEVTPEVSPEGQQPPQDVPLEEECPCSSCGCGNSENFS